MSRPVDAPSVPEMEPSKELSAAGPDPLDRLDHAAASARDPDAFSHAHLSAAEHNVD